MRTLARSHLKQVRREQLVKLLVDGHNDRGNGSSFWCHAKKQFKDKPSSLKALTIQAGNTVTESEVMVELAASYYERLLAEPVVYRALAYVASQLSPEDGNEEIIPTITYPELVGVSKMRMNRRSCCCRTFLKTAGIC